MRLTILGIGNLRCALPIVGALSTYFGERALDVMLWDADAERLELFDKLLRTACLANKNMHRIRATDDPVEALSDADLVVVAVDRNCAFRYLRSIGKGSDAIPVHTHVVAEACRLILDGRLGHDNVLDFTGEPLDIPTAIHYRLDPGPEPTAELKREIPFRVLRWLLGEDQFYDLFREHDRSPLKRWFDNRESALRVSNS